MPLEEARVPLVDRGHLLGDGVFETMRTVGKRVLFIDRHFARLERALRLLDIPEALSPARRSVDALSVVAPGPLVLRVQVTTGAWEGLLPTPQRFHVTAIARPLAPYPPGLYAEGAAVLVDAALKPLPAPLAGAKTLSFQSHVLARRRAAGAGADDVILLNQAGRVCEASTSNLVARVGSHVYAPGPEEGAVDGVVRRWALDEIEEPVASELELRDLLRADEVLLTNTVGGVVPVATLLPSGRRPLGPAGPLFQRLHRRWTALVDVRA